MLLKSIIFTGISSRKCPICSGRSVSSWPQFLSVQKHRSLQSIYRFMVLHCRTQRASIWHSLRNDKQQTRGSWWVNCRHVVYLLIGRRGFMLGVIFQVVVDQRLWKHMIRLSINGILWLIVHHIEKILFWFTCRFLTWNAKLHWIEIWYIKM